MYFRSLDKTFFSVVGFEVVAVVSVVVAVVVCAKVAAPQLTTSTDTEELALLSLTLLAKQSLLIKVKVISIFYKRDDHHYLKLGQSWPLFSFIFVFSKLQMVDYALYCCRK